jgi:hypothetical protein
LAEEILMFPLVVLVSLVAAVVKCDGLLITEYEGSYSMNVGTGRCSPRLEDKGVIK